MALIGRMTKPCPGCQTPVEKLGGCNQMVCMHCNCSFCWICMEHVDRGTFPVHFQVLQQFASVRHYEMRGHFFFAKSSTPRINSTFPCSTFFDWKHLFWHTSHLDSESP